MNKLLNNQEKIEYLKSIGLNQSNLLVSTNGDDYDHKDMEHKITVSSVDKLTEVYEEFKDKAHYIKKIISSTNLANESLKQYEKILPIKIDTYVVGGAIRDLIINPENIKDVDVLVSVGFNEKFYKDFQNENYNSKSKITLDDIFKDLLQHQYTPFDTKKKVYNICTLLERGGYCDGELINKILENTKTDEDILNIPGKILTEKISKKFNKKDVFANFMWPLNNKKEEESKDKSTLLDVDNYMFDKIISVIKMSNSNGYPVDMIFSCQTAHQFIDSFDFEICKTYANVNHIKSSDDFIKNIIFDKRFWNDYKNKSFTINIGKFSDEQIDISMRKHFLNMKSKYNDYKLNVSFGNVRSLDNEQEIITNKYKNQEKYIELELALANSSNTKKRVKI